jgi:hypothetical protein
VSDGGALARQLLEARGVAEHPEQRPCLGPRGGRRGGVGQRERAEQQEDEAPAHRA